MAQPLSGPSSKPDGAAPVSRSNPYQPALYWPVVAVAGALAILVVISVTVAGYALTRKPTQVAVHESPPISVELPHSQPQPVPETPPLTYVPKDDPPIQKPAPDVLLVQAPPASTRIFKKEDPPKPAQLPPTASFITRNHATADDLSKQLLLVPEVGLDNTMAEKLFVASAAQRNQFPHPAPEPLLRDPALVGLPVRMGLDCHLGKEAAENLQVLSRKLRVYISESVPKDGIDTRPDVVTLRKKLFTGSDGERGDWKQAEAIPTLLQLLQSEDKPLRLLLVELLAGLKSREASAALAQRALFDLSVEVREAAVRALKDRPRDEFRDLLLKGLRYPWPAVADHAAEALVALKDGDSLARLVDLLDRPDPSAPYVKGIKSQQTVVREMVRVNHLKNCVLCHAPSFDQKEQVRGLVPDPKKPLPPTFTPAYYVADSGQFVRADITYLKQDFAVPQPVAKSGVWPANQRFDYLVRTRPATTREIEAAKEKSPSATYPQRESVLFALRELTGRDPGTTAEDWRPVLAKALTDIGGDEDP